MWRCPATEAAGATPTCGPCSVPPSRRVSLCHCRAWGAARRLKPSWMVWDGLKRTGPNGPIRLDRTDWTEPNRLAALEPILCPELTTARNVVLQVATIHDRDRQSRSAPTAVGHRPCLQPLVSVYRLSYPSTTPLWEHPPSASCRDSPSQDPFLVPIPWPSIPAPHRVRTPRLQQIHPVLRFV